MKHLISLIAVPLFLQAVSAADHDTVGTAGPDRRSEPLRPFIVLAYDRDFSELAGTEDVATVHYGFTRLEDALVGTRWFPENSVAGKSGGVAARLFKTILFDSPIDTYTFVFEHEYFGHGMRFRELTDKEVKYHLSAPFFGGGSLLTISNGLLLVFTFPLWLIGGTVASVSRSYDPVFTYPGTPLTEFAPYARYPQGLPPDLDRGTIRMKGKQ